MRICTLSKSPSLGYKFFHVAENHAKLTDINHALLNVDYGNYTSIYQSSAND